MKQRMDCCEFCLNFETNVCWRCSLNNEVTFKFGYLETCRVCTEIQFYLENNEKYFLVTRLNLNG